MKTREISLRNDSFHIWPLRAYTHTHTHTTKRARCVFYIHSNVITNLSCGELTVAGFGYAHATYTQSTDTEIEREREMKRPRRLVHFGVIHTRIRAECGAHVDVRGQRIVAPTNILSDRYVNKKKRSLLNIRTTSSQRHRSVIFCLYVRNRAAYVRDENVRVLSFFIEFDILNITSKQSTKC